jgi:phenylalanyl-tRNA synthetase beta chain
MLEIPLELKEAENPKKHFIDGRVADIFIGNKKIGSLGEVHPKILRNWKIKMPVALFEIELDKIFEKLKL